MNVCFIGFGNMAKAIAKGILKQRDIVIHACAPSLREGQTSDGIHTHQDNNAVLDEMELVILAVKPHQISTVLPSLSLNPKSVLVSIAAGATLDQLQSFLPPQQPIVRTMPNTPLAVGYGATQLVANPECSQTQRQLVERLFANSGIYIWLEDEEKIDAFTGLSGSGPAYIFYILEALIEGGEQLGIPTKAARQFAEQTMLGALQLSIQTGKPLQQLRKEVTSPGGATAEAIAEFDCQNLKSIIAAAMAASCRKAKQLKESV